jgi:hypothetical protein
MVLGIKFDGSQSPAIKTRLMKTPCYYADYHTRYGQAEHALHSFSNWGISRMSMVLGFRNFVNTALVPAKFGNSNPFLMACYDVGRHFLIDPSSLKMVSPLGKNSDWIQGAPTSKIWPFPLVQATAHPSFDANTQEFFSVNYASMAGSNMFKVTENSIFHLKNNRESFKQKLKDLCNSLLPENDIQVVKSALHDFFHNLDHHLLGAPHQTPPAETKGTNVFLLRWKGDTQIEKWQLHDQNGNELLIEECMHQTSITQDFIILTDTAFKFTLDLLINNPFPDEPAIDNFIRQRLSGTMEPFTRCYIIKRADLVNNQSGKVTAWQLQSPLPLETIHYSADYDNPNNQITLYATHNAAACVAEWVRTYDVSHLTGQAVDPEVISIFAVGSMDLNRIGKWVIDMNALSIDQSKSIVYQDTGTPENPDMGPNTWALGLYTYRDMISPNVVVPKIKYLWHCTNGLDPRLLTEYIFNLYKDYPNRIIPVEKMIEYTKMAPPFTILRLRTDDMQPEDHYQFPKNVFIRSPQFVPNKTPSGKPYELDGYIVCSVQVGVPQEAPTAYQAQYWVFDAANLNQGPVCKMTYDGIVFCFTLHCTWLPDAEPYNHSYMVDVEADYNETISQLIDAPVIQDFFNRFVYPDWNNRS